MQYLAEITTILMAGLIALCIIVSITFVILPKNKLHIYSHTITTLFQKIPETKITTEVKNETKVE